MSHQDDPGSDQKGDWAGLTGQGKLVACTEGLSDIRGAGGVRLAGGARPHPQQ